MTPPLDDVRAALEKRDGAALAESTRDPIFLLQSAFYVIKDEAAFDAMDDAREDHDFTPDEIKAFVAEGLLAWEWRTESVWLSREEAEAFRAGHAYRWEYGSRVYCIPCEGALADLLKNAAPALLAQIAELKAENERLRAERDDAQDLLGRFASKQGEPFKPPAEMVFTATDEWERQLAQARAEAFEEAAKVADMWDGGEQYPATSVLLITDAIAATIRALAERKDAG